MIKIVIGFNEVIRFRLGKGPLAELVFDRCQKAEFVAKNAV